MKIETNGVTITDDQRISAQIVRPESDVGYSILLINDYQSKNYSDVFAKFNSLDISISQDSGSYTKVFSGPINNVRPRMSMSGEVLEVNAWDWGLALKKTHCNTGYGAESANPSTHHIQGITQDLVTNYINKSFNGSSTEWGLTNTKIENVLSAFEITSLESPYLDNFTLFSRICDLGTAYGVANATVGPHWYVDPDKKVYLKLINADSSDGLWTRYYKGSQSASTLRVKKDLFEYDFQDLTEEYANIIVLASAFRKPAYDIWSEDGGPSWGTDGCTATYSTDYFIVGSHSLKLHDTGSGLRTAWYPSGHNAGWDFTKCGTQNSIPHFNFYVNGYKDVTHDYFGAYLYLATDSALFGGTNEDYFAFQLNEAVTSASREWFYVSVPVGPYWAMDPAIKGTSWKWHKTEHVGGAADWSNINAIILTALNDTVTDPYYDDIHFSGQIIREAIDTSEVTATKKARQHFMRLDSATDDTLKASDDSGTAARLAYAELLKRSALPMIGKIRIPGAETFLPGQTTCIYAGMKADGAYRINGVDMRARQVTHFYDQNGFITELNLTSDVTNAHALAVPTAYSQLKEYAMALGHAEAKDLKSSGIDVLIPKLSKSY